MSRWKLEHSDPNLVDFFLLEQSSIVLWDVFSELSCFKWHLCSKMRHDARLDKGHGNKAEQSDFGCLHHVLKIVNVICWYESTWFRGWFRVKLLCSFIFNLTFDPMKMIKFDLLSCQNFNVIFCWKSIRSKEMKFKLWNKFPNQICDNNLLLENWFWKSIKIAKSCSNVRKLDESNFNGFRTRQTGWWIREKWLMSLQNFVLTKWWQNSNFKKQSSTGRQLKTKCEIIDGGI